MDLWQHIRLLALALLVGYFVRKIIDSSTKLHQSEIGLSFGKIREELVEGSRDCFVVIGSEYFDLRNKSHIVA